jgi:hypothetical protein
MSGMDKLAAIIRRNFSEECEKRYGGIVDYFAADPSPYTLSALRFYIDHRGQYHYY